MSNSIDPNIRTASTFSLPYDRLENLRVPRSWSSKVHFAATASASASWAAKPTSRTVLEAGGVPTSLLDYGLVGVVEKEEALQLRKRRRQPPVLRTLLIGEEIDRHPMAT